MIGDLFSEEPKRSPEELFGRAEMAEDLAETVIHNKITVVKGYRRVGKSSLVCSMSNILAKKKKYILLHAEVVARHSEEELEKSLSSNFEDTYHRLDLKPPK